MILLEQNYRSTQTILTAANHIIRNNKEQKEKNLWTDNTDGEKIIVKEAANEREEASYIIDTIRNSAKQRGGLPAQTGLQGFTVLYRTHAQSRSIEEALLRHGLPYRILGGVRFYERREIKDILAYLRLARNSNDTVSFARIYNTPIRGIGATSFKKLKKLGIGAKDLATLADDTPGLTGRQIKAFRDLGLLLNDFSEQASLLSVSLLVKYIIKKIGYERHLNDRTAEGEERWENVKEILTATRKFDDVEAHGEPPTGLDRFLEEVALIQETDKLDEREPAVTLMTLHSAKGLEFPTVFIVGLEEGIFPHSRSVFNPSELEEERRLCYVGVTRAKSQLHLSFCRQRALYGSTQMNPPSRFIFEIPEELVTFLTAETGIYE